MNRVRGLVGATGVLIALLTACGPHQVRGTYRVAGHRACEDKNRSQTRPGKTLLLQSINLEHHGRPRPDRTPRLGLADRHLERPGRTRRLCACEQGGRQGPGSADLMRRLPEIWALAEFGGASVTVASGKQPYMTSALLCRSSHRSNPSPPSLARAYYELCAARCRHAKRNGQTMSLWATTPTVAFAAAKPAAPGMSAAPIVSVASRKAAQITAAAGMTHHRPMMKLGSRIVGITELIMPPRRVAAGSPGARALVRLSGSSHPSNPPPPLPTEVRCGCRRSMTTSVGLSSLRSRNGRRRPSRHRRRSKRSHRTGTRFP